MIMEFKRLTLLCGHYGSGKTNIAINLALELKNSKENVAIADLDIVNPYFRTKDSAEELKNNGIKLIVSKYAGTNVDIPALPAEMYSLVDDKSVFGIIDVGGDDRGALAMGRITPAITEENNFDALFVINKFRPLTPDVASTLEVLAEVECACGLKMTGIINNSNLGTETTSEDVLSSLKYANAVSKATGLPLVFTAVDSKLADELKGKIQNLLPLKLQDKIN